MQEAGRGRRIVNRLRQGLLAVYLMMNIAVTGDTYDIDGGASRPRPDRHRADRRT
jgi:hypothetical protein